MKKETVVKKWDKKTTYTLLIGLGIGIFTTLLFYPERIAVLKDGSQVVATSNNSTITADLLYERMKDEYAISAFLNQVDENILTNLYETTEEIHQEIEETAEYYINMYETYYDMTEEEFLTSNGFDTLDEFKKYLKIDYLRNLYYEQYTKEQISEKEIKKHYKNEVYGAIETKYIAVDLEQENGKDLIEEILQKISKGSTYEDITKEYSNVITYQDLGFQAWNSSLDSVYLDNLTNLKNNKYTTKYVTTDFGYTIIFRGEQEVKKTLEEERENIIEYLANELKQGNENLYYKALIEMRKENNLDIKDTDLEKKYKAYCNQFK